MSSSATLTKPQQRLIQATYCSCSKFVPQAFNSNKCQTCFNTRDSHTSEALADFQKSNRKVWKFGYLFIAPSDLELNKTKRWQWRFFVFYDDGELTYSLDDNPLTVPQGRINMSMCEHIAELSSKADYVSYPNSLCLKFTKPLKDMYIAAGNYEEMIKWKDVICSFASKCHKKNFLLISQKLEDDEMETENENVPERDTTEKNESQEEECKEQTSSESVSDDSNRRLSYKEDDLIRKQRLKENLNQLLIEYKHEEEANMKKMSKQIQQNRQSLPQTSRNKSSAFSLVAPPSTNNSAFRPVNSLTNLLSNQNSLPLQMQSNKLNKTQSSSAMISSNKNNSPSSSCSWSSSAKPRANEDYKKPCLISPRKQTIEEDSQPVSPNLSSSSSSSTSSTKSLTIRVQTELKQQQQELDATLRNIEIIDLTKNCSNSTNSAANSKRRTSNLIGYLWKLKDSSPTDNTSNQFNKYWFSLNMNLCCLIYWNDKYEQDIGKFPIGKFELTKCCQIFPNDQSSNTNDFRLSFHQNTSALTLRASSHENKIAWCDSIRSCIENQPNQCTKCKPKLVVNPMPAFSNSTTPTDEQMFASTTTTTTATTTAQPNQQMSVQISQSKLQSPSQITPRSECQSYEALKNQHEKLLKDNSDLNSKFKILEQIHLDSVAEFDQQQSRLYNQLDELAEKLAKTENELDLANKKNVQSNDASLDQIKKLNETIEHQQKEVDKLNKKLSKQLSSNSELGWNKEVKNLDARISDVLGKIKERELNLAHKNDEALKLKCERLQRQLVDAQSELLQLKQEKSQKATRSNLHEFSDDLTKVLMSKEDVISQLEAQIRDKDRQIGELTIQLNEEISKSDKLQDAFNLELDRNNQLKSLADNLNEHYAHELNEVREELKQSKSVVENLESRIQQINDQKDKSDTELKNAHESAKNEIETLQEETKTLEFKLVHSQRQAQEYQTILEDMDMQNSHTINQLNKICANMDASVHNIDLGTSNGLHNRLKRNQSCVNLLTKQILELKDKSIEELGNRLKTVQCECDALKEENIDLNDHIYSIDVYMREKEAECDQLKKEKEELMHSLSSDDAYNIFLNNLMVTLKQKTSNMDGLVKFCENIYLCDEQLDEALVIKLVSEQQKVDKGLRKQALKDKAVLALIKKELNELVGYLECGELNELNSQVTSYMAEQLIHKAALNGNLKFACEVLRTKRDAVSDAKVQSPSGQVLNVVNVSEQDEKIFKLASELLLSDEDSLRKLSAQVLSEVQHLTQLNCVVNTLKKLRLRYLRSASGLGAMNSICAQLNSECEQESEEQAEEAGTEQESEQIRFILEVIRDIFIQHKNQVSDQLNEVHKLMSISSFNDLVAHLQNENSVLKKELSKLQGQVVSNNNFLDKNFGNRIFSPNNFQSKSGSQLRKFGLNADNATQKNPHSHHLLTDLLSQDDTMC